ncbi:MAG: VOC family protein [Acidimicrobiales bacterium]|nr:VOC family protein [Acidimicrobiales bacterium]
MIELGHVVLYVRDAEVSGAFYGDVLGWPVVATINVGGARAVAFSAGRTHHELLLIEVGSAAAPLPAGRRLGMYHFGIKVGDSDDELRAMLGRLADHHVTVVGSADHTITHSLYVLDPDGNEIELYTDVADIDWATNPDLIVAPIRPLRL